MMWYVEFNADGKLKILEKNRKLKEEQKRPKQLGRKQWHSIAVE